MGSELTASARAPLWLRTVSLLIAALFLVWLPIEDVGLSFVVALSAASCAWIGLRLLVTRTAGLSRHIIVGALAGLAVSPLAIFLMVFKSGLHAHGFPDFAPMQMRSVLNTTPWFILAGSLFGWLYFNLVKNSQID